jgi:predicted transcriptional regulator
MKESSTNMKDNNNNNKITWRRNKVQELSIKGFSQAEISRMLQISEPTISRDIDYLKQQANETIKNHIQKKLPYEYSKCISGLEEIIKESWIIATKADQSNDIKNKLQSLALAKDTYNTKMDLLTNASLLTDSIKFVEQSKQNLSNKKENIDQSIDIQRPAETNNNDNQSTEQSTVF